jgi:hypothetical protein
MARVEMIDVGSPVVRAANAMLLPKTVEFGPTAAAPSRLAVGR